MARKKKTYTIEFRKKTAELVIKQGYSVSEAAENFGIHPKTLWNWVSKYGDYKTDKNSQYLREELAKLRKENKKLRLEREVLKKAAVFFAKEMG